LANAGAEISMIVKAATTAARAKIFNMASTFRVVRASLASGVALLCHPPM
jgi:hypothetical protein